MVSITDKNDMHWDIRFGVKSVRKACRRMKLTLAQFQTMDVEVADLIDFLDIVCEKQIKERGLTTDEFWDLMDFVDPMEIIEAVTNAIVESFPGVKDSLLKGGKDSKAPFELGTGKTS